MKTIIVFLLMTGVAIASPCKDYRERFERAKKFGATKFKCVDRYDGSATSSFYMDSDQYKKFIEAEIKWNENRIKRKQK